MTMPSRLLRAKSCLPFVFLVLLFALPKHKLTTCAPKSLRLQLFASVKPRRHILFFVEQTHLFDPESAMVYHNMRFWRQVFIQAPLLAQQLKDMIEQSMPSKHDLLGPVTLFQRDMDWLNCRFSPDVDAISNEANECILFTEPDKKKFEHFIREQIRKHFYQYLEQKHPKWQGVAHTDLCATTKLLRGLEPSSPYRNPPYSVTFRRATPHRLCLMRIKATPHCPYCLHEDSSIQHVIWDCPRFAELRKSWPSELNNRGNWPTCAKHAMICTTTMSLAVRNEWHKFQFLVAQVLWQWMKLNRNSDLYQQFTPEEEASRPVNTSGLFASMQASL